MKNVLTWVKKTAFVFFVVVAVFYNPPPSHASILGWIKNEIYGNGSTNQQKTAGQLSTPPPGVSQQLWCAAHPGLGTCAQGDQTGVNSVITAVIASLDRAQSSIEAIAVDIFFMLAPISVLALGIRIAFNAESGVVIPVGRLLIALSTCWIFVEVGPYLSSAIVREAELYGTGVSQSMNAQVKANVMSSAPGGFFSSGAINALMPNVSALDPWNYVKAGLQESAMVMIQAIPTPAGSTWGKLEEIGSLLASTPTLLLYLLAAIVILAVFAIVGIEAAFLVFETHVFIMFTAIAAAFTALNAGNIGPRFAGVGEIMKIVLGQAMKVFVFFLAVPIISLEQSGVEKMVSTGWGIWSALVLIASSVVCFFIFESILKASGKIFGHGGMSSFGKGLMEFAGGMALGAATGGAGGAAMGAAKGAAKSLAASKGSPLGHRANSAFRDAAGGLHKGAFKGAQSGASAGAKGGTKSGASSGFYQGAKSGGATVESDHATHAADEASRKANSVDTPEEHSKASSAHKSAATAAKNAQDPERAEYHSEKAKEHKEKSKIPSTNFGDSGGGKGSDSGESGTKNAGKGSGLFGPDNKPL